MLAGRTLFITGATGFVGRWLLAAIGQLNARLAAEGANPLRVRALVRALVRGFGPLHAPWLSWVEGDVRRFHDDTPADLILHAALSSAATPPTGEAELLSTATQGIEACMRHAKVCGVRRSVVLSSGAVHGTAHEPLRETSPFAPLAPGNGYASAKRAVETVAVGSRSPGHDVVIARLFTCLGTGYRSHGHLAHVSMLDDVRAGRRITIRSDGSAVRSYLFGADLALWLLTLLAASGNDIVNVGSDAPLTLREFAHEVARVAGRGADWVEVAGTEPTVRPCFVPDIGHARTRYGLAPWTPVASAIAQTLRQQP